MRYRALSPTGDYTFGQGKANFLVNSVACVAQKVRTRLKLWEGEWFLDVTEGTAYAQKILGYGTAATRDLAVRERILATDGVTKILEYASATDPNRGFIVSARIETVFGEITVTVALPNPQVP